MFALASKLIGWNVDIKSEEEKRREIEAQMAALTAPGTPLTELAGVGPKTIEKLEAAGITSIEKLADMTPEQLVEIPGIGEKMVEKIHQSVAAYFEALDSQATAPVEPSTEDEAAVESVAPDPEAAATETAEPVESTETSEAAAVETSATEAEASAEETPEDEETTPADKAAAAAVDESAEKQESLSSEVNFER